MKQTHAPPGIRTALIALIVIAGSLFGLPAFALNEQTPNVSSLVIKTDAVGNGSTVVMDYNLASPAKFGAREYYVLDTNTGAQTTAPPNAITADTPGFGWDIRQICCYSAPPGVGPPTALVGCSMIKIGYNGDASNAPPAACSQK